MTSAASARCSIRWPRRAEARGGGLRGRAMSWLHIGGSLVALAGIAGLARYLKLGESRLTDRARACEIAEQQLVGFEARRALPSGDGSAALVAGNGTVALLRRHGVKVTARRLVPPLKLTVDVEGVRVDTGERWSGGVTLTGVLVDDVRAIELTAGAVTVH